MEQTVPQNKPISASFSLYKSPKFFLNVIFASLLFFLMVDKYNLHQTSDMILVMSSIAISLFSTVGNAFLFERDSLGVDTIGEGLFYVLLILTSGYFAFFCMTGIIWLSVVFCLVANIAFLIIASLGETRNTSYMDEDDSDWVQTNSQHSVHID